MSTFQTLVEAIGRASAEKLIAEFGGRRIYVPVTALPDSPIAAAIGAGAAARLSRVFGGDRLQLPVMTARYQIVSLRAAGKRIDEIAGVLGCTRRWVQQVLADGVK